jgi:hypothetical protein
VYGKRAKRGRAGLEARSATSMAEGGGWRDSLKKAWGDLSGGAHKVEQTVVETAKDVRADVAKTADAVTKTAGEEVDAAKKYVDTKEHEAKDFARDKIDRAEKAVESGAKAVRETAHEAKAYAEKTIDQGEHAYRQIKAASQEAVHDLKDAVKFEAKEVADQALKVATFEKTTPEAVRDAVHDTKNALLPNDPPAAPVAQTPGRHLLDDAFVAAGAAYTLTKGGKPPEGWGEVKYPPDSAMGKAMKTAECFEIVSPSGQHFVTFAGTHKAADVLPDIGNALDMKTEKYEAAATIGEHMPPGAIVTGHSLGGGEAKTAAAVASHATGGHAAQPVVCIGFNPAPVSSNVLAEHGVDEKHPDSINIQVINKQDPLNRDVYGGLIHAADGRAIEGRESKNEVVVLAGGQGSAAWVSGHGIASLADPDHPDRLVADLKIDGNPIDKAAADRFSAAELAAKNAPGVTQQLEQAAPAQSLKQQLTPEYSH